MDYIALNHNSERAKGIIYNSSKPIGGIYYQDEKERPVSVEKDPTTGRKQAFVEIERKFAQKEKEYIQKNKEEIKKIGEQFLESPDLDLEKKELLIFEKVETLKNERSLFEKRIEKHIAHVLNLGHVPIGNWLVEARILKHAPHRLYLA